jgi:hypothetical protein
MRSKLLSTTTFALALAAGGLLMQPVGALAQADADKAGDRNMSKTRATTGAAAGSSTRATFPQCSDAGAPEEVTRCLNREMAQALERGVGAREIINR